MEVVYTLKSCKLCPNNKGPFEESTNYDAFEKPCLDYKLNYSSKNNLNTTNFRMSVTYTPGENGQYVTEINAFLAETKQSIKRYETKRLLKIMKV